MAEKLLIEISLTKADTSKAFDDLENKASKAGQASGQKFGNSFSKQLKTGATSAVKSFAAVAVAAFGVNKALESLSASFENLRGFSRGIAEINSILPKNQKLTEEATQKLIEFSTAFGGDQQKQARAFYNIVSAGVKGTTKQLDTLAIANRAAVAGLVDIDDAAKVLVSSVNAYASSGLTAKQASDDLFVAVREGQTTFGELSSFLGNVTSVAASAGLKFNELAGFLAFATKNGLATDVAVTGLRQVLTTIIKPSKEASDEAKRLGLEFNTSALRAKGLSGFLSDLVKSTGGSSDSLSKLFGNVRALTPILQVANGNFSELDRILNETKGSGGATASAFRTISQNLDFKLETVSSEFSALGLNLLRTVNPALTTFADGLKFIGKALNSSFSEESTKPIDVLQRKLKETNLDIRESQSIINSLKGGNLKTFFGGESVNGKNLREAREALVKFQATRKELLAERATLIDTDKALDDARVQSQKNATQQIIADEQIKLTTLQALGLKTTESILAEEDFKTARLQEIYNAKLISEAAFQESLFQIKSSADDQIRQLDQRRVEASINASQNISGAVLNAAKNTKVTAIEIGKTMNNLAVRGFGNAFQKIGAALANGENINQAFVDSVKNTASQAASAFGDYYIKLGVAEFAATSGAKGSATIAGGAGLKLLAGVLGASGGGGTGGVSAGGVSEPLDGSIGSSGVLDPQDVERNAPSTNVEVVVQGSLVQQEELGQFITETLNESFGKQGVSLVDARFA